MCLRCSHNPAIRRGDVAQMWTPGIGGLRVSVVECEPNVLASKGPSATANSAVAAHGEDDNPAGSAPGRPG